MPTFNCISCHTSLTLRLLNVEPDRAVQQAFDQWCFWHILRVHFSARVTNHEIHRRSAQPPLTLTIKSRRLKLFGHIVHSDPDEDHPTMFALSTNEPPNDWRRPRGCPRQTWLRTVDQDLRQQNIGLWAARHSAQDRARWRQVVVTATLQQGLVPWWWRCCLRFIMIPPRFYGQKWLSRDVHHARPAHRLSL